MSGLTQPQLLEGIRVIEFARLLAAPYCGLTLSDLGADVIKVESPLGDETRWFEPFLRPAGEGAPDGPGGPRGESGFFHAVNRGKRGIAIDLRDPRAAAIAGKLIEGADVVIENMGASVRYLGTTYEQARARNPKLVWCSVTGYGAGSEGRAVDPMVQADIGLMAVTGEADGPPARVPAPIIDLTTGLYAAQRVLAALWRAERSGEGAFLDCALIDAAATITGSTALLSIGGYVTPRRLGSENYLLVPSAVFEAGDGGHVQTIAITDWQWAGLCRALGRPEWIDDPLRVDNAARLINRDLVHGDIRRVIATGPAAHWVEAINAAGGLAGLVKEIDEAWENPVLAERDLIAPLDDPELAAFPVPLLSLARTADASALAPGPRLGADTAAVMGEIGVAAAELDELIEAGVVMAADRVAL